METQHQTTVSKSFPSQQNPRIILISSRVPAADVSFSPVIVWWLVDIG